MRKSIYCTVLLAMTVLLPSCGLAQSAAQTAQRTLQSVGRTVF